METQNSAKTIYNESVRQLTEPHGKSGISSQEARTIAFWLIEDYLGLSWTAILMDKEINAQAEDLEKIYEAIQRIINNEPVQYVLGFMDFYGRRFAVNPDVLIPRRETEELVSLIIRENKYLDDLSVLDLGTGSGCIAITLAKELNRARVSGIDNSEAALEVAKENAFTYGVQGKWIQADILSPAKVRAQLFEIGGKDRKEYDVIVGNPPYVRASEKKAMAENVLNHEPATALFVADEDPLLFYRKIMEIIRGSENEPSIIRSGGQLFLEVNEAFGEDVGKLLGANGFEKITIYQDMQRKDRVVTGIFQP